jgi:dipeptidyl aminopeptidase/acylaminoacyl peptidase
MQLTTRFRPAVPEPSLAPRGPVFNFSLLAIPLPAAILVLSLCPVAFGQAPKAFDAAAAFGARPSVTGLQLSPDGLTVSYITPTQGQGSALTTLSLAAGAKPRIALSSDGDPDRIEWCRWVSNDRLACMVYAIIKDPAGLLGYTRLVAVNSDGSNLRLLSRRDDVHARGVAFGGGQIIDWLPGEDGVVLMTRVYVPNDRLGTRLASSEQGLGVDRVDTRDLSVQRVEPPKTDAAAYISDGHGSVRIMATTLHTDNQLGSLYTYLYRMPGSQEWHKLSDYDSLNRTGFEPVAVDPDLNVAYGFKKKDGRLAVYSVLLDGSLREQLIYANPDVDVDDVRRLSRRRQVVGASYATEMRHSVYFAPEITQTLASLARALPQQLLDVVDSSTDDSKMLIFAGRDTDPGVYYILDRKARQLQTFLVARDQLEGVRLAEVKPVSYPAGDGAMVPGYLTLPPGMQNPRGLPAIVLPHGGPSARDEWGFDWLSQFYASRGYAVLQPNFRGSSGYGDAWFEKNGFQSWRIAIGDVIAAGHWLVSQGIADPARLGIVGWSYGGYAALQSAVVEPSLFKAVVAIAPVTDLPLLKEEHRRWSDYELLSQYVGDGAETHEGSPLEHADSIRVPVLMFHGAMDRNVNIEQSQRMAARLKSAGVNCELVTWEKLDHQLEDSSARAQVLRESDAFLRRAFGVN